MTKQPISIITPEISEPRDCETEFDTFSTSFVMRLRISPCLWVSMYLIGSLEILAKRSLRITLTVYCDSIAAKRFWKYVNTAEQRYTAPKMRQGGLHKIAEVIAVIFSAYAEHSMDMLEINVGFSIYKVVCSYLIVMECISIIENLGKMNPNVFPKKISKFFEKIRKEIDVE